LPERSSAFVRRSCRGTRFISENGNRTGNRVPRGGGGGGDDVYAIAEAIEKSQARREAEVSDRRAIAAPRAEPRMEMHRAR